MKKVRFLTLVTLAIIFTVSVSILDSNQIADAMKSKGTHIPEIRSSKVCGDKLCSEIDSEKNMKQSDSMGNSGSMIKSDSMMKSGSMDMQKMMDRMDRIHEKHQQHMMQSWNSMTHEEQSQMYQQMQKMMEKMESMDMQEHMKMMSGMGEKDHDKKMNMSSDEKSKKAESLAMQHLKTFDELDFDVFTNQNWDRLNESHSQDIIVHWPDGSQTEGIERHIEDLKAMFVYAPDTRIQEHPVRIASGEWTSVIGVLEGTFTEPMPLPDGTTIPPTGKEFKLQMVTVGHWKNGVMDEEYLFWDNMSFMRQIGLGQ